MAAVAWLWNPDQLLEDYVAAACAPPPRWMRDALCVEYADRADDWFPGRGDPAAVARARAVCAACAVRAECLDHALRARIQHGIWGGKSERERRQLRLAREIARYRARRPPT